jgi:hypothetical protein
MNVECLIIRLSFLELMKLSLIEALVTEGRDMRPEPDLEVEDEVVDFVRMEGRFLGIVGACAH